MNHFGDSLVIENDVMCSYIKKYKTLAPLKGYILGKQIVLSNISFRNMRDDTTAYPIKHTLILALNVSGYNRYIYDQKLYRHAINIDGDSNVYLQMTGNLFSNN